MVERDTTGEEKEDIVLHPCLFPFTSLVFGARFRDFSMCFLTTLLLGCILLLAVMPALTVDTTTSTMTTNRTVSIIAEPTAATLCATVAPKVIKLPPQLTRVKVQWEKDNPCQGLVLLLINFTKHPKPLCLESFMNFQGLGAEMCKERKCGNVLGFRTAKHEHGYVIKDNKLMNLSCPTVLIKCEENNELVPYKAVVGLLVVLVLVAILLQFGLPSYKAIRKRLSQKRQNRWIGPTQSQSVSYHRGHAGPNNNTVKRHSYPGLERLTVYPSREPSSNRNSDYDSYGCN